MKAPHSTSTPKVLCPRGQHLARCVQVVDLGTQHFKKGDEGSRKLYLGFETSETTHVFKDENGPEPFMLQAEFAFYMGRADKKTKLRTFIESWFSKAFPTDAAAADFDFSKLLGREAVLTVAHKPKTDGSMKAVIADIFRPDSKQPVPACINPTVCYEVANGEDAAFAKLPPFLQSKIRESDEFAKAGHAHHDDAGDAIDDDADDTSLPTVRPDLAVAEDDIPF